MQQNKVKKIKATDGNIFKLSQSKNGGSDGKESICNVGDLGLVPGLERSYRGGHGNQLQYSCMENPHGQWSLGATFHGAANSWTQLSDEAQHKCYKLFAIYMH